MGLEDMLYSTSNTLVDPKVIVGFDETHQKARNNVELKIFARSYSWYAFIIGHCPMLSSMSVYRGRSYCTTSSQACENVIGW